MKKYLFFLLLIALMVFSTSSYASAAGLSLYSANNTYEVGDIFYVDVVLNTQGSSIQGVDVRYLNYDPTFLELIDADNQKSGIQIKAGSLMSNTVANSVSGGKILFSQTSAGSQSYLGSGTLATLKFKVLKSGSTKLNFNFVPNSSLDANIASNGQDIISFANEKSFNFLEKTQSDVYGPVKIYFSKTSGTYGVGDSFSVNVMIDTGGKKIDAVDFVIRYNKRVLEVLDSDLNKDGIQIKEGNILNNIQINEVNSRRSTINFSKTTNQSSGFVGSGLLATINFKAIDKGKAYLAFYFRKNSSVYTSFVSEGRNILEEAKPAIFIIDRDNLPLLVYGKKPTGFIFADRSQMVSMKTNKKAYCKYSLTSGLNYDSMKYRLRTRDGVNHSLRLRLSSSDSSKNIFIRCQDKSKTYTSSSDYVISFNIVKPPIFKVQTETSLRNYFDIDLIEPGKSKSILSFSARPNRYGSIRLPRSAVLSPGYYDVSVKSKNTLKAKVNNIFIGDSSEILLPKLIAGDVNGDGVINSLDWSSLNNRWFKRDYTYDINGDRIINSIDWSFIKKNWLKRESI